MIKRNVVANVLGGSWSALLLLLIIPFQVRILGVEVYGLLAFLASLQIVFSIFDLGLSQTITREVASDSTPDFQQSRDLVQSLSTMYWAIGVALGTALALGAGWIVGHWLKFDELAAESATLAIQLYAIVVALRWPITFYTGVIGGRQRFATLNLLTSAVNTMSFLGGVTVLVLSSSLTAFLTWRIVVAFIEVLLYVSVCLRLLPGLTVWPRVSFSEGRQVWRFAFSMHLIVISTLLLTQSDKFLISKLLPVAALGYYSVAYTAASSLALVQGMVTSALFPVFTADYSRGELAVLASRCAKATQVVSYCAALPAFLLICFGYDLLRLWVDLATARAAYEVLGILAFAFLLGAPLNVCSTLAIATGHPRIPLVANVIGLCLYIPCLYILIVWGALYGAALALVFLQLYYMVMFVPPALRILGEVSSRSWIGCHIAPFVLVGAAVFGVAKALVWAAGGGLLATVIIGGLSGFAYLAVGSLLLHRDLRADGQRQLARLCLALRRLLRLQGVIRVG